MKKSFSLLFVVLFLFAGKISAQESAPLGFAVVDFAKHQEVARILFPKDQERFGAAEQRQRTPSHGIRVSPDGHALWVNSTASNATYKYSLPDLKLVGFCELPLAYPANRSAAGAVPDWIAITPDSSRVYVSTSGRPLRHGDRRRHDQNHYQHPPSAKFPSASTLWTSAKSDKRPCEESLSCGLQSWT
jgi:hypothetical protein